MGKKKTIHYLAASDSSKSCRKKHIQMNYGSSIKQELNKQKKNLRTMTTQKPNNT